MEEGQLTQLGCLKMELVKLIRGTGGMYESTSTALLKHSLLNSSDKLNPVTFSRRLG